MTELAGIELRAAVATLVMGRKVRTITNDDSLHAGELCRTYGGDRDYIGNGGLVFDNEPGDLSIAHEVPHYETDIAAAAEMEAKIKEIGLADEYASSLATEVKAFDITLNVSTGWDNNAGETQWSEVALLIFATPEQRCRAALAALEEAQ
jgi:hypothetical protein